MMFQKVNEMWSGVGIQRKDCLYDCGCIHFVNHLLHTVKTGTR